MISEPVPPDVPLRAVPGAKNAERARVIGVLLVFVSGVAFSTKAILVKLAYRHGVDAVSLLALRFGFSAPFFALGVRFDKKPTVPLTRADALIILGLGVL